MGFFTTWWPQGFKRVRKEASKHLKAQALEFIQCHFCQIVLVTLNSSLEKQTACLDGRRVRVLDIAMVCGYGRCDSLGTVIKNNLSATLIGWSVDVMSRTQAAILDRLWKPCDENVGAARWKDPESPAALWASLCAIDCISSMVSLERSIISYVVWATVILDFLSLAAKSLHTLQCSTSLKFPALLTSLGDHNLEFSAVSGLKRKRGNLTFWSCHHDVLM